jgi:uncharacterized protein (TIGR02266 family)
MPVAQLWFAWRTGPGYSWPAMGDEMGLTGGKTKESERRQSLRVPVEMWVEEVAADHRVFRRAGNLSTGGLHLDKTIPIAIGTHINLSFTLPNDPDPVTVEGDVVSIDANEELGMGVKFRSLSPEAAARIGQYLKRSLTPVP